MMKKFLSTAVMFVTLSAANAFGQDAVTVPTKTGNVDVNSIIKKFTDNEAAFRQALTQYVFNRTATVNIIGMGGQIAGTYRRDSFMSLLPDGTRMEKILFFPVATTPPGFVTPEDLEDLGGINPFALEPASIPNYNITYVGKERIDDLNLYVFDVTPKVIPNPKKSSLRLFTGRVWVDDRDLMIVKSKGKALPETKENKFPIVETWRENVEGKYWFPSEARSDDELVFDSGQVIKIRMRVKFTDYKMGRTDVRIVEEDGEELPVPTPSPTPDKP
jgi:hypothetical protein